MNPFQAFRPQVRRLAKTASWLVAGKIVTMLNSVLVAILIARHLGPSDYGVLSYALTLLALARPLVGFGLSNMVLRDIRRDPAEADGILGGTMVLRAAGGAVAAVIVAIAASFSSVEHPNFQLLCVTLIVAALFASPRGVEFFFIATGRPQYFVIAMTLNTLCFAALKIAFVFLDKGVDWFMLAHAAEMVGIGVVSLAAYVAAGHDPRRWSPSRQWIATYFRRGRVLLFGAFAMTAGARLDIILVAELVDVKEAGIYAAAARISEILYNLPVAVAAAVFPFLVDMERGNAARYRETLQLVLDGFAAAALALVIAMSFAAAPLIALLLGPGFAASADILVIHVWVCLFVFTRAVVDNWLISKELDALSVRIHMGGVAINVALNLLLIPIYGAKGAAYAILGSYATATVIFLGLSARGRPILVMLLKAIFTWPLRMPRLVRRVLSRSRRGGVDGD